MQQEHHDHQARDEQQQQAEQHEQDQQRPHELGQVQVWRIIYKEQRYYLDWDAVQLVGNGFSAKLFGRVGNCR